MNKPTFWNGTEQVHKLLSFEFDDKRQVYYNTKLKVIITKEAQDLINQNIYTHLDEDIKREQYEGWKFTSKKRLINSVKRAILTAHDIKKQQRIKNALENRFKNLPKAS